MFTADDGQGAFAHEIGARYRRRVDGAADFAKQRIGRQHEYCSRDRGFEVSGAAQHTDGSRAPQDGGRADAFYRATLDIWYYQFRATTLLAIADSADESRREPAVIDKARLQSSRSVMSHSTEVVNGKLRIRELPLLVCHIPLEDRREHRQYDDMIRRFFAD